MAAAAAHAILPSFGLAQTSPAPFLLIRDLDCDLDRHPVGGVRALRNRGARTVAAALAAVAADWRRTLRSIGLNLGSANVAAADWRLALPSSSPNLGSAPAAAAPVPAAFAVPLRIWRRRRRLALP